MKKRVAPAARRAPADLRLRRLPGRLESVESFRGQEGHLDRRRGVVARVGIRPIESIQGEVFRGEVLLPELQSEDAHRIGGLHSLDPQGNRGKKCRAGLQGELGPRLGFGLLGLEGRVRLQGPGYGILQR